MSSEEAAAQLQEELSCSICLECFKEPVSIHCGHSFCQACITTYWDTRKKKSFSCPRCRESSRKKILQRNRELKNIAEIVPKLIIEEEGERMCKRHQEPLKLFCKDDRTPICMVCDKSKQHQSHTVLPMEEAMQDYKGQMQMQLELARKEKEKLLGLKAMGTARSKESLKMIHSEMQKTVSSFKQARQFLDEQLQVQVAQWKSLQAAAEREQKEYTTWLLKDISQLDCIMAEVERKWWKLEEVNITLTRFKNRTFHKSMQIFPELQERLDSLIKQNAVTVQTLQKFEDTLASELGKNQLESPKHVQTAKDASPLEVEQGESSSLAAKRKKLTHTIDPARNEYSPQNQGEAACSWQPLDLCSGRPSVPPSQPVSDDVNRHQQETSFLHCLLS